MNEICGIKGKVTVCLRGPDGRIKERYDNLIVTTGRHHVADQLVAQVQGAMSHMAIGTITTPQELTDVALGGEIHRKPFTSKTQGSGADANKVVYICEWPAGEGSGAITEAGLFNSSTAGIMLCRTTFPVKNKGTSDSLTLTWTITISG